MAEQRYELSGDFVTWDQVSADDMVVGVYKRKPCMGREMPAMVGYMLLRPVPAVPAEVRYYKHKGGFQDYVYVKLNPNGTAIGVDANGVEHTPSGCPWSRDDADDYVARGWWIPITEVEAKSLIVSSDLSAARSEVERLTKELAQATKHGDWLRERLRTMTDFEDDIAKAVRKKKNRIDVCGSTGEAAGHDGSRGMDTDTG